MPFSWLLSFRLLFIDACYVLVSDLIVISQNTLHEKPFGSLLPVIIVLGLFVLSSEALSNSFIHFVALREWYLFFRGRILGRVVLFFPLFVSVGRYVEVD